MSRNLLSEIAFTVGRRRAEDVASAALRHLAASSPRLGSALTRHLSEIVGTDLDVATYDVQVSSPDLGRADIVGRSSLGVEAVIIEAKINAGVHGEQIVAYLRRVVPTGGHVVLLAPKRRLPFVRRQAAEQAASVDGAAGHLYATSWEDVVAALRPAVADDPGTHWELEQVAQLYREIEGRQLVVIDAEATAPDAARSTWSMFRMVDSILNHDIVVKEQGVEFAARRRTGQSWGYGGSGTVHGREVWFGCWLPRWVEPGGTPFWLHVQMGPGEASGIVAVLNARTQEEPLAYERSGHDQVEMPLYVPPAATPDRQVEDLASMLVQALNDVRAAVATVRQPSQRGDG